MQRFDVTDVAAASTPMDPKIKFDKSMSGSPSFHGEYRHAIGCLQYLVTCSHPDIAAPVSIHSAYKAAPTVAHWKALSTMCACLLEGNTHSRACFLQRLGTASGSVGLQTQHVLWYFL